MIYDFTKSQTFDIGLDMDIRELRIRIEKIYPEKDKELMSTLKKVIKDEQDFKTLVDKLNLSVKEFLNLMVYAYPELFNHYLIKYIRKNYVFKEESEFAKL